MIFATAAVGTISSTSLIANQYPWVSRNLDVHILTDRVDNFKKVSTPHYYGNKIWSYFDKLLFIVNLAAKYNTDVFYSDADKIGAITSTFYTDFEGSKNILVKGTWEQFTPEWADIKYKGDYWKPFVKFLEKSKIHPSNCPALCEQHIYIPKNLDYHSVLLDLEIVKPVLEYSSIVGENKYTGIGSGEGAGLGYALLKNNLTVDFFDSGYFGLS